MKRLETPWKYVWYCSPGVVCLLAVGEGSFFIPNIAHPQIIPDQTLGAERSRLRQQATVRGGHADLIEGGAIRGGNLFHSFDRFSVEAEQRVYFSNPSNVDNILGRVTGNHRSDINGTLGVDGNANLFLLNPNGIVFGPNAQLDVAGAFVASTGDRFTFGGDKEFSARDPHLPPLVEVDIPIGVQFGDNPPASIMNEADLAVGSDLTLAAGTVTNIGTLNAGGQVQVTEVVNSLQANPTPPDTPILDSTADETTLPVSSANANNTVHIGSAPNDPVTVSWIAPAETGIQPDNTLGSENSQLVEEVEIRGELGDRVDGGAARGPHLFHSFRAFNVEQGDRVYFSNPTGIETILSRVTGNSRSDIMGTLGVDGSADLFMINPNGMIFGPNAQLDVSGSFLASTGDRFTLGEGLEFRTDEPNAAPEVAVNIPVGLQYSDAPARLISQANLETGENLTLTASGVNSQGTLSAPLGDVIVEGNTGDVQIQQLEANTATLHAGQDLQLVESTLETSSDLTLQANDTVLIRDSVDNRFVAIAGGDLFLQGNNRVDIFALNHPDITPFQSIGNLTLVSDGLVSGDSHFYSGGQFSIETLAGGPADFISLQDPIISSASNVQFGNYDGAALKVESLGSIRTKNITIRTRDLNLEAFCSGNSCSTDAQLLSSSPSLILRAGLPALEEVTFGYPGSSFGIVPPTQTFVGTEFEVDPNPPLPSGSIETGIITAGSRLDLVNGNGDVILDARTGDVVLNGSNSVGSVITGRSITINALGSITANAGGLNARTDSAVPAGNITIGDATLGAVPTRDVRLLYLSTRNGGVDGDNNVVTNDGGTISVTTNGALEVFGGFDIRATNDPFVFLTDSDGTLDTQVSNVDALNVEDIPFIGSITSQANGDGGDITISAAEGIQTFGSVISASLAVDENDIADGGGGDIQLEAADGGINLGHVRTLGTVSGGDVCVKAGIVGGSCASFEGTSTGGTLSLIPLENASITVLGVESSAPDNAGDILIEARDQISTGEVVSSSNMGTGVDTSGDIDIVSRLSSITIEGNLNSSTGSGDAGDIRVQAAKDIIVDALGETNALLVRSSSNSGSSDSINFESDERIVLRKVSISSRTSGTVGGDIGNIFINAPNIEILNSSIRTDTFNFESTLTDGDPVTIDQGKDAGSVAIGTTTYAPDTDTRISIIDSEIGTDTHGFHGANQMPGNAGNITIGNNSIDTIELIDTGTDSNSFVGIRAETHAHFNASRNSDPDAETYSQGVDYGSGQGGFIAIDGQDVLIDRLTVSATTFSTGEGGDIFIDGQNITLNNGAEVIAETSGAIETASGGDILIGMNSALYPSNTINILNSSQVSTNTGVTQQRVHAQGGNDPNAPENFDPNNPNPEISGFTLSEFVGLDPQFGLADAGNIFIGNADTNAINIQENSNVQAESFSDDLNSAGASGIVTLLANGNVTIDDSQVSNRVNNGTGNDINITGGSINILNNSNITTDTSGTGQSGSVAIMSTANLGTSSDILIRDSRISARAVIEGSDESTATAGNISLIAQNQGAIQITNSDASDVDGVFSSAENGFAGDITIDAGIVTVTDAQVLAETTGGGTTSNQANITFQNLESLAVNGGVISSSTDTGMAGTIQIEATESVLLIGDGLDTNREGIFVEATHGGNAGGIAIDTQALSVLSGAGIIASSQDQDEAVFSNGTAGNVDITAETIQLNDALISTTNENAVGGNSFGNVSLQGVRALTATNSEITASTEIGNAGSIMVNANDAAAERITLTDALVEAAASDTNGAAGDIILNTQQLTATNSTIQATNIDDSDGGTINVQNLNQLVATNSTINTDTESGVAGNILVNQNDAAATTISLTDTRIQATSAVDGEAGNIAVNAQQLTAQDSIIQATNVDDPDGGTIELQNINQLQATNSLISTETETGVAGSITITEGNGSDRSITFNGTFADVNGNGVEEDGESAGGIVAAATDGGTANDIVINTQSLTVENGAQITASSGDNNDANVSEGIAGTIDITATDITLNDALISTTNENAPESVDSNGNGTLDPDEDFGNIRFQDVDTLDTTNSLITASTQSGFAGSITINAGETSADSIELTHSKIEATATQENEDGNAGSITFSTRAFTATASEVAVTTQMGLAGDIIINADGGASTSVELDTSELTTQARQTGGRSGDIDIQTQELSALNSDISATNINDPAGGKIAFAGINTLSATNSAIETTTNVGQAGNITVNAGDGDSTADSVILSGSRIAAEASRENTDSRAGNIIINANDIEISASDTQSSEIVTQNVSSEIPDDERDEFGNIRFETVESLTVSGSEEGRSRISTSTESGNAGSITVNANDTAAERIILTDALVEAAASDANGEANDITLNTQQLTATNATIQATNIDDSDGGTINVQNLNQLIATNSAINTDTESGVAGNIVINQNDAAATTISLTDTRIQATSAVDGEAGNIAVNAQQLTAQDSIIQTTNVDDPDGGTIELQNINQLQAINSLISTQTETGTAGRITITEGSGSDRSIIFNGTFADVNGDGVDDGGAIASATGNGSANDIIINADTLSVENGAAIAVDSNGTNESNTAGNITITALDVTLNNGQIRAETNAGGNDDPANITLERLNTLVVNDGEISSSTQRGRAGTINIDASTSVAITGNVGDGDREGIFVEATNGGNAGSIAIDTQALSVLSGAGIIASSQDQDEATFSNGTAGNVVITAETIQLNDALISTTNENAVGGDRLGNVSLQGVRALTATNSEITASTEIGNAGSVTINEGEEAANAVRLSGSGITAEVNRAETTSRAGNIVINARDIDVLASNTQGSEILTRNRSSDIPDGEQENFGNIRFETVESLTVSGSEEGRSRISTSTESGDAGSITVNIDDAAAENITLTNAVAEAAASETNGTAGDITFNTQQLTLTNSTIQATNINNSDGGTINLQNINQLQATNSLISTETKTGVAGRITITEGNGSDRAITFNGINSDETRGGIVAEATQGGQAGNVEIATQTLVVRDGAEITASTRGEHPNPSFGSRAGNVDITAQTININNARIATTNIDAPESGNTFGNVIFRDVNTLNARNSLITASTERGVAGSIVINEDQASAESVVFNGTFVDVDGDGVDDGGAIALATGNGSANNILINADRLRVKNGAAIAVDSNGTDESNTAGDITITALDVTLNNGQIRAETHAGGNDDPANITFERVNTLVVNDSEISSSTQRGRAGTINIDASTSVAIIGNGGDGDREGIFVEATNGGDAGNIAIDTPTLRVRDGAAITASSGDSNVNNVTTGTAGNVDIIANTITLNSALISTTNEGAIDRSNVGNVRLQGVNTLTATDSDINASTQTGEAGDISINKNEATANSIRLSGSRIIAEATETSSTSRAGNIFINARNIDVSASESRVSKIETQNISSRVPDNEQEDFGNIRFENVETLVVRGINGSDEGRSRISTSTDSGDAGSIDIRGANNNPIEDIDLVAAVIEAAASETGGVADDITIDAQQIDATDSIVRATNISDSDGGAIEFRNLNQLQARNSLITTSTESGVAGSITMTEGNATDRSIFLDQSNILAEAAAGGQAGNINISTDDLELQNGSQIQVSSPDGQAGNIELTADQIHLDNSRVLAETGQNSDSGGANISLSAPEFIIMTNDSLISAQANRNANGGNIDIDTRSLIGLTPTGPNGSDIVANAAFGDGGVIDFEDVNTVIGFVVQRAIPGNRSNDVDVSSTSGTEGTVLGSSLVNNQLQGLTKLPTDFINVSAEVRNYCSLNSSNEGSSVTLEGRGGMPTNPTNILSPDLLNLDLEDSDWINLEIQPESTTLLNGPTPEASTLLEDGQISLGNVCHRRFTIQSQT